MALTLIASVGRNNELGRDGDLCWHIPEDLRHFKQLTTGNTVVMGRKTWESLPRRPLPGRDNIVISRSPGLECEGAERAGSLKEAIDLAAPDKTIYIIGGESIYRQAIDLADTLEITAIDASEPNADTFFPPINSDEWLLTEESLPASTKEGITYTYKTYRRR